MCVTAEEGIECPLAGVTVYSTTSQSRRRLERGTVTELGRFPKYVFGGLGVEVNSGQMAGWNTHTHTHTHTHIDTH